MRIKLLIAIFITWVVGLASAGPELQQAGSGSTEAVPTFTKNVAPILQKHCTACHRPGEIAPMSLLTYESSRPWARSMRDQIREGRMPPWHAEAPVGTFENERRLSEEERTTLLRWADGGAPEGDPKDLPPPPTYTDGWTIGRPDAVFEMLEDYQVPAEGEVQYEFFYIPTNFTESTYVQAIEVRPGNRALVHHVLVYYKGNTDLQRAPVLQTNAAVQTTPLPSPSSSSARTPGLRPRRRDNIPSRLLATFAPGTNPQALRSGTAFRLEPGGVIELQMHYTTNGRAGTDRTKVGMIFSKAPAPREVRASAFVNTRFSLPAGASDVRVEASVAVLQDSTLWGVFPHTHLRGKKWEYHLELPDGTRKLILSVPRYDFNWQTYYMFREPLSLPKGSRIVSTAWYDNSAANRSNPDPKVDVTWGDQTWEEMQYTGLLVSLASP